MTEKSDPLPLSWSEAITAEERGQRLRYLFFWGHQPPHGGGIGASCLSQWWEAPFTEEDHQFRTAEHYMMAHKAWLFGDQEVAQRILQAPHPGEVKRLGRQVTGFDQAVWEERRFGIVVRGSVAKFGQHDDLRAFLLGTRSRVLVEASPLDHIWGIGLAADDPDAATPSRWCGQNLLGFALMHARDALSSPRAE